MNGVVFLNIIPDCTTPETNEQWDDLKEWGIGLATTVEADTGEITHWVGGEIEDHLIDYLASKDLCVSYNYECFDYDILSAYGDPSRITAISLMDLAAESLGYRVRLQNLGKANGKSDATKMSLNDVLGSTSSQWIHYNINKCETMKHVIERAIERNTLWHCQPATFDQIRFSTGHWQTVFDHARRRF